MFHLVSWKSLHWLSHILRSFVVMLWWVVLLLAFGISNPFIPSHLTRCLFHPLYLPPRPLMRMHFLSSWVILEVTLPHLIHIVQYVADEPRKIMWNIFFDYAFDFSMAFGKFKRVLTLLSSSFLEFSYFHHCEIHASSFISSWELSLYLSRGVDSWAIWTSSWCLSSLF